MKVSVPAAWSRMFALTGLAQGALDRVHLGDVVVRPSRAAGGGSHLAPAAPVAALLNKHPGTVVGHGASLARMEASIEMYRRPREAG